eukprot:3644872-Karenia_brevis.AAC.1
MGGPDLAASAAYTPTFCQAIINAHMHALADHTHYHPWYNLEGANIVSKWFDFFEAAGFFNPMAFHEAALHGGDFTLDGTFLKKRTRKIKKDAL